MVSVNTNFGASIALQALNRTNRQLDATQKRISTGFRVADAKDDGAAFAVAQGLRAQVKGNEAVLEQLASYKGLLTVSMDALKMISDTGAEMRKVLTKMADENLSTAQRTQYYRQYRDLDNSMYAMADSAVFKGKNILTQTNGTHFLINNTGSTHGLAATNVTYALTSTVAIATMTAAQVKVVLAPGGDMEEFEGYITDYFGRLGAAYRVIDAQEDLISKMSDALNFGIGARVDADLAKESARMQSLQIRQQLGTQALSLANQKPSSLLDLFR